MAKLNGKQVGDIPGTMKDYAGGAIPTYYLACDGSFKLIATYPVLYASLGGSSSPYGSPDGFVLYFYLPDSRGRLNVGIDTNWGAGFANRITSAGSGITGTSLGANGGFETHTLSIAEMPSHNHTVTGGNSSIFVAASGHTHSAGSLYARVDAATVGGQIFGQFVGVTSWGANFYVNGDGGGGTGSVMNAGATIGGDTGGLNSIQQVSVDSRGGSNQHTVTQPTLVVTKIIKY